MNRQEGRGRGQRGRPRENTELREEIRRLQALLEAMEMGIQWYLEGGDISEPSEVPEEEEAVPAEVILLRAVLGSSFRPNPELSIYDSSLKVENLIDWIREMDKYF